MHEEHGQPDTPNTDKDVVEETALQASPGHT